MSDWDDEWRLKGATLSDKTACEEFGLTREEIFRAVKAGELQGREASIHGNPWLGCSDGRLRRSSRRSAVAVTCAIGRRMRN